MSSEEALQSADAKMHKAVDALGRDLATVRTGRANPALVEHLRVDYHGVSVPLNQVASISVPEARLLVIQPWEKQALVNIERAILKSDLGLNPASDGNVIRLAIPQLTQDRREQLVKMMRRRTEEARVAVRNVRRETVEGLRKIKESKELSEDEQKRALNKLQRLTDNFVEDVNRLAEKKEAELMEL
ncbi:ribosome recycling factor [Chloroflexota bacterium]